DRKMEWPHLRRDVRGLSRRPRTERLDDFPDDDQVDCRWQAARGSEGHVLPIESLYRVSDTRRREGNTGDTARRGAAAADRTANGQPSAAHCSNVICAGRQARLSAGRLRHADDADGTDAA